MFDSLLADDIVFMVVAFVFDEMVFMVLPALGPVLALELNPEFDVDVGRIFVSLISTLTNQ